MARVRPVGTVTRGTTNPNRLRRADRYLTGVLAPVLRGAADPLLGAQSHDDQMDALARAMREAVGQVWKYGDAPSFDLSHALAAHHRTTPDSIMVGEGIDGLLGNLVRIRVGHCA